MGGDSSSHRVGPRNPGGRNRWSPSTKTVDRPMVCSVDIRTCFVLLRGLLVDERSWTQLQQQTLLLMVQKSEANHLRYPANSGMFTISTG